MNKTLRNLALVALATAPFSVYAEVLGSGTAADPYQIATAEDIEAMHTLVKADEMVYFVQTADIDMSGVTDHIAPVGSTGQAYNFPLNYDGRNHVIKNFAPKNDAFTGDDCYAQSVFGVFSGELKNLGIVDMEISAAGGRGGAIGGYLGQSTANVPVTKVSNVYVTGKVYAGASYMGGLFGTTGTAVELNNCFVNVTVDAAQGALVGALGGRLNNPTTINNCYVAGTVSGAAKTVCAANTGAVTVNGFVVFASGAETGLVDANLTGNVTIANTAATKDAGVAEVQGWDAFSATETVEGLPALNYAMTGAGTAENPYIIDSPEALCNAYRYVNTNATEEVYFVQTADIDMEGVEDYHAINGYNGAYCASINYDGQNHLIKNFAPNDYDGNTAGTNYYYNATLFGVATGTIKNLGVVDAYIGANDGHGVGILGGYLGHSAATHCKNTVIENVFVTGEVAASNYYAGGMFGAMGPGADMTASLLNCFANVTVSTGAANRQVGAIVGRTDNVLVLENVYAAGEVAPAAGSTVAGLIAGTGAGSVDAVNTIAFNTGADKATGVNNVGEAIIIATEADKAELIATVQGWEAFSADKLVNGYPALAAFDFGESAGIFDIAVDEVEANGPAVYYNLQGVQVANPENGVYIVRRGNKVTKELIRK